RHLFPEPSRTRDDALDHFGLRVCAAVAVAVGLALSRQGSRGSLDRHWRAIRLLQRARPDRRPADRWLLARPPTAVRDRPRQYPAVLWRIGFLLRSELRRDRTDHDGCDSVRSGGRPDLRHWRLVRRFAVRQSQRSGVPLDLLRADRGGGDLRSAGAGWRAALRREIRRVGKGALAPGPSTRTGRGWWARFALPTLRHCGHQLVEDPRRRCFAGRASGSGSLSAPIRRNADSAARSPLSQAPSIVPHSVSWVASPAR